MAFALLLIGLIFISAGLNDRMGELTVQLKEDLVDGDFILWIAAIGVAGAVGYVPALRTPSRLLMGLILLVIILGNSGFYAKFMEALQSVEASPPPDAKVTGAAQEDKNADKPTPPAPAPEAPASNKPAWYPQELWDMLGQAPQGPIDRLFGMPK